MPSDRRALLRHLLGATGAAALPVSLSSCARAQPIPDGALLDPGQPLGHRLRDAPPTLKDAPAPTGPLLDVLVVGGGVAGLSACWRLRHAGVERVALLELDDVLGGTARGGTSVVSAYPWGAHYVTTPLASDTLTTRVLDEAGVIEGKDALGHPVAAEHASCRAPDERLFAHGVFHESLSPDALLSAHDRRDLARFEEHVDAYAALVDGRGRPAFALPRARSSDDAELLALDKLSFRDWLLANDLTSPHLHWLCDYATRDDDGVSLDECSAWAGLFYFCARRRPGVSERGVITHASGNGPLLATLARGLPPPLQGAAVDVGVREVDGQSVVHVAVLDPQGALRTIAARRVVVATPRFVALRIVETYRRARPAWADAFTTSAWVVCNVHLDSRPQDAGVPFAWDTVYAGSDSLGVVSATHQSGRDHGPTVWTWYLPLTGDPRAARRRLQDGDRAAWADACLVDLARAHPGVRQRVRRVDVCRWGHAMVRPTPGLFSSGALAEAQQAQGPISFAHSDLSGMALFEEALFHGTRAAEEALAGLGVPAPSWLP